jgi:XRE family transcriptional regulator, fatty acid utilization regulator
LQGIKGNPILPKLALNLRSSFEDAVAQGEALAAAWGADGGGMASRLHEVAQSQLNILVLMADAPSPISGAACQMPEFYSVIINRNDVPGRRHFDFAHELFHLLTWDTLTPRREDFENRSIGYNDQRIERMAENFSAGLLMPRSVLEPLWKRHEGMEIHHRLLTIAKELGVTAQAVRYRAWNLKWIGEREMAGIDDHRLVGAREPEDIRPLPFSKPFVERLRWGLAEGRISARRAAQLLDMSVQELAGLIRDYGMEAPFDL